MSRARELELARSTAWRRLLLYRSKSLGRYGSQVDGADFFLAANGKKDPAAELEATIAAFFVPQLPGQEDKHALCKFPARRMWLDSQLHFLGDLLQPPKCPALERYDAEMDVASATFVYASNFLDNPASAFGHTFLRLAKKGPTASQAVVDLRDHGIDYTAATDTANPLLYAFKGLAGLFPGTFRFRTYDAMLRDYAGYEARDLWEYELALTPVELEMLVMHLWELANTSIDYLYLTENCSYQIIAALDAASPRLDLVASVKADVLPLDTVKAVQGTPGLVHSVIYRPSVRSLFRASLARLDGRERDLVAELLVNADAPLPADMPPAEAALVLDTAKLAVDAQFAKSMTDGKNSAAVKARERLVERRDRLGTAPIVPAMTEAPRDKEPHKSHGSMRVVLGTGMTSLPSPTPSARTPQNDTGFATLGYRLALHDLADPPDGEPELLQLQFLETRGRYDYGRRKVTLDTLIFADVMALNPLRRFEKKLSWRARAFGTRLHDRTAPDSFAHGVDVSLGYALGSENDHVLLFLMADAYVAISGQLDGVGGSVARPGVGPFGGVRVRLPASTVAYVTGTMSYLPAQDLATTFDIRAVLRTSLASHVAMGFEGAAQPRALELQLASYLYF
ncbi:MAG: hypothetical protein JWO86_6276 [Myxococcaceae bacterium]|nr:hypothetical protein [Myxococcaceae bacterium]MEA2749067.1 hypothetical protein [Myxococcales bacterium]